MPDRDLTVEFAMHERGFFAAVALIVPNDPALRYEFIGEPTEGVLTAEEFKVALGGGKRFLEAGAFEFYVVVGGVRRRVSVPLPEWPVSSGYTVREAKVLTKLII